MDITFGIPDWHEELLRSEEMPRTEQDLIDLAIKLGWPTAKIVRHYIVSRELGEAGDDVLPENKTLFQNGGTQAVDMMYKRRMREIELDNGRIIKARELVGPTAMRDEEEEAEEQENVKWAVQGSPEAREHAWNRLRRHITGDIRGRFVTIHLCDGDVKEAADFLHGAIDGIVDELT